MSAHWTRSLLPYRSPDFIVGEGDPGGPYMLRWYVIPRNKWFNVYLHKFLRSDTDIALHDHPWRNLSIILHGRYIEETPVGRFLRRPFHPVLRTAVAPHRLELIEDSRSVWSLFLTGPVVRDWGFHCPKGWRIWTDVVTITKNGNHTGRGCD